MGSKSQKQKVYDFLMSLDYGLCHGPIDHLNMVWIKDKPILCDRVDRRKDIEIWLPELFGGDTAEGGVGGTLEVYMGTDDQFSSSELSSRDGRTVLEMPGYRGLSHLFFRGFRTQEASQTVDDQYGDGLNLFFTLLKAIITGNLDGLKTSNTLGWKWGSNNPYMPSLKANVTRLPTMPNPAYKAIWPLGSEFGTVGDAVKDLTPQSLSIIRDDNGPGVDLTTPGTIIDMIEQGATQEQIDAGEVLLRVNWDVRLRSWTSGVTALAETQIRFYADVPTVWDQTAGETAPVIGEEALAYTSQTFALDEVVTAGFSGAVSNTVSSITAPVGTRYIQIMTSYNAVDTYRVNSVGEFILAIDQTFTGIDDATPVTTPSADEYRTIYAAGIDNPQVPPFRLGTVVDLLGIGLTEEQIDGGLARWAALNILSDDTQRIAALENDIPVETFLFGYYHAVEPVNYYDAQVTGTPEDTFGPVPVEFDIGSSIGTIETTSTLIKPGTRFLQVQGGYVGRVGLSVTFQFSGLKILVADGETYDPVWCTPDQELGPLPDANAANIIYEAMTNKDWGKGESPSLIDLPSLEACAEVIFNERMGISIGWFNQATIEDFIGEILDHVQAFFFQDPETGLWTMKLLRDDYDLNDAFVLDETNCKATNRKRRLWGETINEIVVSYTDPRTEKSATVSAHNNANIQIQGGISSETRDYHGFRNPNIAQYVAERDVAEAGYPLFSCEIEVDRRLWLARPGDIAVFSWPEDGIDQIVVRIMAVDYGKPNDRKIMLKVSEDIFSIGQAKYSAPQTTEWARNGNNFGTPTPLEAQAAVAVPMPVILRGGYSVADVDDRYPNVAIALLGDDDDDRPTKIQVQATEVNPTGSTSTEKIADISVSVSGRTSSPWVAEAYTQVPEGIISGIGRTGSGPGDFFMLGTTEELSELVMLVSLTGGFWTVARGMWDTVPRAWPAGTRLWSFDLTESNLDPVARSASEEMTYYLLPVTGSGVLPRSQSTPLTIEVSERPHAPFRPADAQLDGLGFEPLIALEEPFPTEIVATWKNRNRTTEDTVSLRWDSDSVAVEVGQTTTLKILNDDGSVFDTIEDLTGETHTIAVSLLPPSGTGFIEFIAVRDGIESIMGPRRYFEVEPAEIGWGNSYGIAYGGVRATP